MAKEENTEEEYGKLLRLKPFDSSIIELDALEDIYKKTKSLIKKEQDKLTIDNYPGFFLDQEITKIVNSNKSEYSKKLEALKQSKLNDGTLVSDIFDFEIEDGKIAIYINSKYIHSKYDMYFCLNEKTKIEKETNINYVSAITNMICIFETLLRSTYLYLFMNKPKEYYGNASIMVSDIIDAKHVLLKQMLKIVDSNMYDINCCFKELNRVDGIQINNESKIMDRYNELNERRNLLIHNDGIVNEVYLGNVDGSLRKGIKLGEKLKMNDKYIFDSINLIRQLIFTLEFDKSQVINDEEKRKTICQNLDNYAFVMLTNENYQVADYCSTLLMRQKDISFSDKLINKINSLLAKKYQGLDITDELKLLDVSAVEKKFKIAKFCLESDLKNADKLLREIFPNDIGKIEILNWPLFKEYRESEYFEKFSKDKF